MNQKNFKTFRVILAMILAIIISQSIILDNYVLASFAMIVAIVLMLFVRKKVKDVLADERDYKIAGNSARYAMTAYSAVAVGFMFFFMSQDKINPVYEAIGSTLAYSVCGLMLVYSLIFLYLQKYAKQN
jgi:uncharacterized membrane protein